MEVHTQLISFLTALLIGIILGLIFDFFRTLRSVFHLRAIMTNILDGLYWIIATTVTFAVLLLTNWGELRFYLFMGIAAGAGIYYRWASKVTMFLLLRLFHVIATLYKFIERMICVLLLRPIGYLMGIILLPIRKNLRWIKKSRPKVPPPEDHT